MHDTERLWLTFEITPEPFLLYVAYTNRDFKNMEDIKKTFNSFPITSSQHLIATLIEIAESEFSTLLTHENEFRFRANPDILQNNSIDLHALLNETIGYYRAYQELKEHKIIISSCDNTIIETFKDSIDQMVTFIFKSMSEKHELTFNSRDSSSLILEKLNNGIINLEKIAAMRTSLITLCDTKLLTVQQKLFEMASQ